MADFVIHVNDIDVQGKQYRFPLAASWVQTALVDADLRADPEAGEGVVSVFAQRSGADILVTGKVEAGVLATCIRCLEDAPIPVNAELGSLFSSRGDVRRPAPGEEDFSEDLSPEELARETFSGDEIALDDIVRDNIILELPMQPLCREDCPGIAVPEHVKPPADFGETKDADGVDPRFAGLKGLANQLSPKEE